MLIKTKKGFTLAELIISICIFTVITTAAAASLAPIIRGVDAVTHDAHLASVCDTLANELTSGFAEAQAAPTVSGASLTIPRSSGNLIYSVSGGMLCKGDDVLPQEPVFDENFYAGTEVGVSYDEINAQKQYARFTVTLSESGAQIYEKTYVAVLPLVRQP